MADEFTIFTGTANSRLAENVAREVGVRLGARAVERFPDGEISVLLEEPARGREVFIIQPTLPPVDRHLVELLAFADACLSFAKTLSGLYFQSLPQAARRS
jgi:ribose-phosphate pyrophosphokinase